MSLYSGWNKEVYKVKLIEQIDACVEIIKQYVGYFLCYQEEDYMKLIQPLLGTLEETLTAVVGIYEDSQMTDHKEDQGYWPDQLTRIVEALQSRDRFRIIDSLQNELCPNLNELRGLLVIRGIE